MKKFNSIAIIGLSGKFPITTSLEELDSVFSNKIDAVRPVSNKRLELQNLDINGEYKEAAYLDGIEFFDYQFFEISKNEAQYLDPQQKIAMQLACEAIENSGYSLQSLAGSKTSVLVAAHDSHFLDMLENPSGPALVGNFLDALPARISYFLDLRGEATIIQTSCSSSLTAVYDACIKLNSYETDLVIVGAISLDFRINETNHEDKIGIYSGSNRCKSFDEDADGTNFGEGAGFIILKRLEDAKKNGDHIHALIKSVGINQDGSRSNSLTAPSAAAQAELLINTWEKGEINPEEIGYIEAHGTGTKIGDPIEVLGITKAIEHFSNKKVFCPLGSLKSNYSHFGSFAGLANIIKGIISIQYNKKYPLQNFKLPNKLIDFNKSPVYPISEIEEWGSDNKLFATSAFGISGTNVHLVLSNHKNMSSKDDLGNPELITISVKYPEVYENYRKALIKEAKTCKSIKDFCFTLNAGRNPYDFRNAGIIRSNEELIQFLKLSKISKVQEIPDIVFTCSYDNDCDTNILSELYNIPRFKQIYDQNIARSAVQNTDEINYLLLNVSIYEFLSALGIKSNTVIGCGRGNIVVDYLTKQIDFDEAINKITNYDGQNFLNEERFLNYAKQKSSNSILFVELGIQGIMGRCLDRNGYEKQLPFINKDGVMHALRDIFCAGYDICWQEYYKYSSLNRLPLPGHPFRSIVSWPPTIQKKSQEVKEKDGGNTLIHEEEDIYSFLHELWKEQLGVDDLGKDDDLFELGADSLMGMEVIESIEKRIGIKIDFEEIYKNPTLWELEKHLCNMKSTRNNTPSITKIKYVTREKKMLVSYNQRRMLYLFEESDKSASYNMPCTFKFKGQLNEKVFMDSVNMLIKRNEILHTIYHKEAGEYFQEILADYEFLNRFVDLTRDENSVIKEKIKAFCNQPFNLFSGIPIRSYLIKTDDDEYVWLVNTHHIAADGWSVGVVSNEICKIYKALLEHDTCDNIPFKKIQYVDYAYWENSMSRSETYNNQLNYWKQVLKGVSGINQIPTDKLRPTYPTHNGSTKKFSIGSAISEACKRFSKQNQISLFTIFESIFAITLSKLSGIDDITIGVPVANRKDPETKEVIGFYSNTIAVRNQFNMQSTIFDNMNCIKNELFKAFDNTDVPFEEIVRNVDFRRETAYSPLFQHVFAFQNYGVQQLDLPGVEVDIEILDFNAAKFDLSLTIFENEEEFQGLLEYNTDLYYSNTIDKIIRMYTKYIEHSINKHDDLLGNLPVEEAIIAVNSTKEEDYVF